MTFPRLKADFSLQVDIPCGKESLVQVSIHSTDGHIELRMVCKDMVRRLPLVDQRGYDFILLVQFSLGQVYASPGRAKSLTVLSVGKPGIVRILMSNGAMADFLWTAIANVRSPNEPQTALFLKAFTGLVASRTGSTFDTAHEQLLACIGLLTMITMDTEVVCVIEGTFMIPVRCPTGLYLLGDSSRVLAKEASNVLKGCALIQFGFNIDTVIKSKVFLVTRNVFTHNKSSFYCCQKERQP